MALIKKFLVKLGLAGLTSAALVEKGRNHVAMLDGNATYETTTTDVTVFNADGSKTQTITTTNANGSLRR